MLLREALRLEALSCLAFAGAGGKTTALFQLAREVIAGGANRLILTTTTHLGVAQVQWADHHYTIHAPEDLDALASELPEGVILFTGAPGEEERLTGVTPPVLERIRLLAEHRRVPLLIEADGSRLRPLKAPAPHEPAIPPFVDMVVIVAGLSALGKPLTSEWVHRPEIFGTLSGLSPGEPITSQALVRLLTHPEGGLKNIPPQARRIVLFNQADTPELQSLAGSMAGPLLNSFHSVLIASLSPLPPTPPTLLPFPPCPSPVFTVHEPIAGVILAAGEARRYGQPKPLLEWRGEPFIRHVIGVARGAGLAPVVVVSGAYTPQVRQACAGLEVVLVHNPDWQAGQSSSLQAGLRLLPPQTGGAVFFLADQPQIPISLVRSLVETHAASLQPVVAPMVDGRRANPVLFDRITFPDLMALQGDVGGRALFAKYPVEWVPWHDSAVLLDVDTPEDYKKLLSMDEFME
jgi:molybdenum cofactor cytidylyltransferase